MKKVTGNLLQLDCDVIVHGCNCFCTMGSGIASQIRKQYPEAYRADCATEQGYRFKIGTYSFTKAYKPIIVNAYTQYNFGNDKRHVSYDAIANVFSKLNTDFKGKSIGIPKIGAGLGGGNWKIIENIIDTVTPDVNIILVEK